MPLPRHGVPGVRVYAGENVYLRIHANTASKQALNGVVEYDDGEIRHFRLEKTPTTDRTATSSAPYFFTKNGTITGCDVEGASGVRRGQVWVASFIRQTSHARPRAQLFQGYSHDEFHPQLGFFESPLSGRGYLDWNQDANDVAGSSDTTINLASANARRVVRGVLVKFHCDGTVASRTIILRLRDVADTSGPTGFSIEADVWESPTLTLTADQEGIIYVAEHGYVASNDNGTLSYADNSSNPNPFPLTLEDGETADIIVDITSGQAGDDYDVFTHIEEWLEV